MTKKSFKKIFIGLFLISFSFILLFLAFYFLKVKPTLAERAKERKAIQKAKVEEENIPSFDYKKEIITDESEQEAQKPPQPQQPEEPKAVYSDKEQMATEGFLWIDRKTGKYVVTLGTVNGLSTGSRLDVYDGDNKIGEVVVETPFDVISYVNPSAEISNKLKKDYYKVVIK